MLTHLPLDDELNRLFYAEGGIWRLVWANALGRCVLHRERGQIAFSAAVSMIASGELLWAPPERFERLAAGTRPDDVHREHLLVSAFLRSPAGKHIKRWTARRRLELRASELWHWLTMRALARDDADTAGE
jgi:hypothetical protein